MKQINATWFTRVLHSEFCDTVSECLKLGEEMTKHEIQDDTNPNIGPGKFTDSCCLAPLFRTQ